MAEWRSAVGRDATPHERWPLVDAAEFDRVFAWKGGRPIAVAAFLGDVAATAAGLPATSHAVNACADRYAFVVALAACLQRGICTLLPPSRAEGVLRRLRSKAPDLVLLVDDSDESDSHGLPLHRVVADGVASAAKAVPSYEGAGW
jgi:hypothetical protein